MRPVRDLAEAQRTGDLLWSLFQHDPDASPAYREHLRDVGPRMTHAELLVAVDGADRLLGSITYARAGTPFALVSTPGEGELRMLGVVEHRGRARTEDALVEAGIQRAERDGLSALVVPVVRSRHRGVAKVFQRWGFRPARGRELSPMPGLHLEAYLLRLPRPDPPAAPATPADRPGRWRRGMS